MENQKHTPEPWIVGHTNIGGTVIDPADPTDNYGKNIGIVCDRTHARGIVACVNTCAGLETENLENAGLLRDGLESVQRRIEELKAENGRLIEDLAESEETATRLRDEAAYMRDGFEFLQQESARLRAENERLRNAAKMLVQTIDAHETVSRSCDRDGNHYCDCLTQNTELLRAALSETAQPAEQ